MCLQFGTVALLVSTELEKLTYLQRNPYRWKFQIWKVPINTSKQLWINIFKINGKVYGKTANFTKLNPFFDNIIIISVFLGRKKSSYQESE